MIKELIHRYAKELNIPAVGIAPWPLPAEARDFLYEEDPCPFTAAHIEDRLHATNLIHPQSAIVCLLPYYKAYEGLCNLSRYTWAKDYHLVMADYLRRFIDKLKETYPDAEYEIHCDTSPLSDRYIAYLAGLGFYGRNNCFINPTWGSYVVIGTIMTSLAIEPDQPSSSSCLGCDACIKACLGQSIGRDTFDYKTCKSYLTQKKGALTEKEIQIISKSSLLFGCDRCQEVCPHNRCLVDTPIPEFQTIEPYLDPAPLESMTNRIFKATYGDRAFSWRGKKILLRNQTYVDGSYKNRMDKQKERVPLQERERDSQ